VDKIILLIITLSGRCAMNSIRTVAVTKALSNYLGLRHSAKEFFIYVDSLPEPEVHVDFDKAVFISRSFAHEYIKQEQNSPKRIKKVNVPINIEKMFDVVKNSKKENKLDLTSIKAISI